MADLPPSAIAPLACYSFDPQVALWIGIFLGAVGMAIVVVAVATWLRR